MPIEKKLTIAFNGVCNTDVVESPEGSWQYKYVERYPAASDNHDSLTFDTLQEAQTWLIDNATRVAAHNSVSAPEDLIAPAIIKRFVPSAHVWEPVLEDEYSPRAELITEPSEVRAATK